MFKINPAPTFTVPVEITVPGESQKASLTVTFKHLGKKARKQYFEERLGKEDDAEILSGIIVGWEGADTPYSREALESLLDNYELAATEIMHAYGAALMGAAEKNSSTPPATGQS